MSSPARTTDGRSVLPVRSGNDAPAAALLEQTLTEHPVLAGAGAREQLLAAAWLAGHPAPRTRAAYAADLAGWFAEHQVDVLGVTRLHVDLYVRAQLAAGAASSSVNRRLSALSSFYRHAATHNLIAANPTTGVRRPKVDPDHTTTIGLDREQARALPPPTPTPVHNGCAPPPRSGCCCTTRCGSTSSPQPPSPISGTTAGTGSCG